MKKEILDRREQNEFLAQLDNCIRAFEHADKLFDELEDYCRAIPEKMSAVDCERSDYLHLFENYELDDKAKTILCDKLETVSTQRRNLHNINELIRTWNQHKGKINNRANRPFLRQAVKDRLANLDCDYKFRCLSEEDVQEIIKPKGEKIVKRGRPAGCKTLTEELKESIREELRQGVPVKELVSKYGVSMASCYKLRVEIRV